MSGDIYGKLLGQIVALFNNLILGKTDKTISRSIAILNPPPCGLPELCRMQAKEVWFTEKTEEHLKILVKYLNIITETSSLCRDTPKKELEEILLSIVKNEALRCAYLDGDSIFLKHNISLLECRAIADKIDFARKFFDDIKTILISKQTDWLNIFPIMKIKLDSCELGYDGISVVSRYDKEFWSDFARTNPIASDYDICNFNVVQKNGGALSLYNETIVVCKNFGSQGYAKLDAELKTKKFLSVLFSFVSVKNDCKLHKAEHREKAWCIQLPVDSKNNLIECSSSGNLLPCYIRDYAKDTLDMDEAREYYRVVEERSGEIKKRIFAATTYINHAMNSGNSIDIFLNYYISLDALFGLEYYVEKSIEKGINLVVHDRVLKEKFKLLHQLRNELVHGGSRYIEEWAGHEDYYHKFKSNDVLADIEKIAFECLNKYPHFISDSFWQEFKK